MDDSAALNAFRAQRPALLRYARSIVSDATEAEDVVQEAWLRYSAVTATRPLSEPLGYFRMIIRNIALDGQRRRKVEARIFDAGAQAAAQSVPSDAPDAEAILSSARQLALTMEALEEMPERMRIAVEMHRLGGRKLREIAEHLGVSVSTAQVLVIDGIERCRARACRDAE
ncbi:MAG: sigma-70 family RNA polymerase sigma factor [Novosphingobium sp.]